MPVGPGLQQLPLGTGVRWYFLRHPRAMAGPAGELAALRGRGKGLRKTPCGEDSICSGIAKLMVTSFIVLCIRDVMCKRRKARQEVNKGRTSQALHWIYDVSDMT
eukprot:scaffold5519_cov372-Pinguiococcus_pyrenoidosus.AAC.1